MREVRRRLYELRKENEELKVLLLLSGKSKQEYEFKIQELEKNYADCVEKLHKTQSEVLLLQQKALTSSLSSSSTTINENFHQPTHQTIFLSPTDYANFMGMENSLKYELEEVDIDPYELYPTPLTESSIKMDEQNYKRRQKCRSDTDDSSINDSAYSDTESLSSVSSCRHREFKEKLDSNQPSRLRLVKRLEGSVMLKRWQELATPSFSSCLQSIPGVYTRAEILQGLKEEDETYVDNDQTIDDDISCYRLSEEKDQEEISISCSNDSTKRMALLQLLEDRGLTARTFEQIDSSPINNFSSSYETTSTNIDSMREIQKNLLSHNLLSQSSSHSISKPTSLNLNTSCLLFDSDDDNESPETPPSTPIQNSYLQTNVLLNQVMQRLVGLSFRTIQSLTSSVTTNMPLNEETQTITSPTITMTTRRSDICPTPPSSPTFELVTPTPNTVKKIMKTSTFIRVSALNPYANKSVRDVVADSTSPNEVPSALAEFTRSLKWK
ncbi:unnamed protein product [Didymodactylos carnosus]|nr:unnamed protein product [Didymodactylos carnosus]CAF3554372.1 unnamed protein product [Didymodactylos carnosus]